MSSDALTTADRFEIFEQIHRHQMYIDNDGSIESVRKYQSLYWPEAKFTVNDLRNSDFDGMDGLKQLYDYAHSVFPLDKWRHAVGSFLIDGAGDKATAIWRWTVAWKAEDKGVVSTGTYTDEYERRSGTWKCIKRVSDVDTNWPADLFQPFVDKAETTFRAS